MNLKRTVISVAAAGLLALSVATGAVAQGNQITQVIEGGELTASLTTSDFPVLNYSDQERSNNASMTLRVDDERGTYEGWNVTLQASNFVYSGNASGSNDIPAENLHILQQGYSNQSLRNLDGGNTNSMDVLGMNNKLHQQTMVLRAQKNAGAGSYELTIPVQMKVRGGSPVGSYTSTITVTSSSGPNGNG